MNTPLIEEISPSFSPLEIFELFKDEPYAFFLDSGMDKHNLGRYSFLGRNPFLIFKSKGEEIEITRGREKEILRGNPFLILKELFKNYKLNSLSNLPPFLGGAVGYFAYDLCHFVEKLPSKNVGDLSLPDCYLGFYDTILMFDHLKEKAYISVSSFSGRNIEFSLKEIKKILENGKTCRVASMPEAGRPLATGDRNNGRHKCLPHDEKVEIESNFLKANYLKAVERAKDYISAGDIYQVNLSQRFSSDLLTAPFELYKRLRKINPAPFASFLNFPEVTIVSVSPERFLRISGRKVVTRPIKGTRPRGQNPLEDEKFASELLASPKDRAELVMIIDLERNDLGRTCEYGSVWVPQLITLETHPTVFHLVGTIEGRLREGLEHLDCLRASFPGGSITGAPKIRAMEIIEELEPTKRSIYTGSIGYLGFNRETDLNIVIRTMLIKEGKIYFQVGGGIVADSEPEEEYQETLSKARALVEALSCPQLVKNNYNYLVNR